MDKKLAAVIALAAATSTITGCGSSLLASRTTNPVIQDFTIKWFSDTSSLSTTASRRLALMVYKTDAEGRKSMITCAEPPPDVGETFAKAIAAQLEVSAPTSAGEVKVGGGYAEQVATAIAPLMVRSQGLQILRDSAYTLCVDYMNGWIADSDSYMRIKQDRFDKALALIREELPYLPARSAPLGPPAVPKSAASAASGKAPVAEAPTPPASAAGRAD